MHLLDISSGCQDINFGAFADPLHEAISRDFLTMITLIAEPGNFYASGFYKKICQVLSRRKYKGMIDSTQPDMLYLNDCVYGCFSLRWSENGTFVSTLLTPRCKSGLLLRE